SSALTAEDVPDVMNEVGDRVIAHIMEDNPEWHAAMGNPLSSKPRGGLSAQDAAQKITGKIPLIPDVEEQRLIWELIEEQYRAEIAA
ncbi:hypothetical protein SB717_37165, partial [Priestia sp. SIMBA_032]|uniref:hypothetical protein n=1 Tax=Priestia sp. SIMBA_032 TaxID=3085775 RepID=UPI003978226D